VFDRGPWGHVHAMVRLAQYRLYLGKSWFMSKNTTSGKFDIEIAFLIEI
jgi:hypothetical protein